MSEFSPPRSRADSLAASGTAPQQENADMDGVLLVRGLRGYSIQLEYVRQILDDENHGFESLCLVDNSELSIPLTSDEIGQLVGLVWKYKSRLENCSVAWVSSQPCVLEPRLRAELPIALRHFRNTESARAWLMSRS